MDDGIGDRTECRLTRRSAIEFQREFRCEGAGISRRHFHEEIVRMLAVVQRLLMTEFTGGQ